jgi:hypothetical protein
VGIQHSGNVRPCVTKNPVCRKIGHISKFTDLYIIKNSVMNLLLTLNTKTLGCGWFKEDILEKNPWSLQSHWSFSAHQVFRHAGTNVITLLKNLEVEKVLTIVDVYQKIFILL